MKLRLHGNVVLLVASILVLACDASSCADDAEPTHQLSLADLTAYHSALTGKVTANDAKASDPPARVSFKDLWNRVDAFRGRRVTVQGRVERTFRQGPVGSFPALAEIWITSPAGDPFCLVVPQEAGAGTLPIDYGSLDRRAAPQRIPKTGKNVQFTGTFLKMVRYAAGDGARLAPLVVGDQPPVPARDTFDANGGLNSDDRFKHRVGLQAGWLLVLILALLAAGLVAWRLLYVPTRRARFKTSHRRMSASLECDPPLLFIGQHDDR
jgi:hypothetical protein